MLVIDLLGDVAESLHDPAMEKVDLNRLIKFLNDASRDARNEGWYVHKADDTSIVLADATYDYEIPAAFCSIYELWMEDIIGEGVFATPIQPALWTPELHSDAKSYIHFYSPFFEPDAGRDLKIKGQGRPSTYTVSLTGEIDANMESFLRERALSYAARFLASGGAEFSPVYDKLGDKAWAISERLLHSHPQQMRQRTNSKVIPGR